MRKIRLAVGKKKARRTADKEISTSRPEKKGKEKVERKCVAPHSVCFDKGVFARKKKKY